MVGKGTDTLSISMVSLSGGSNIQAVLNSSIILVPLELMDAS